MNDKIELLALKKNFSALSTAERNLVLSQMSQEDFEQMRSVLLAARLLDADVFPPTSLKAQLKIKMAAQPKPSLYPRFLSSRVPMWPVAAAFLLGVIAAWLLKPTTVREKIVTEIQLRTDTVWQEKTVWRERVVLRERIVYRDKPAVEPIALLPEKEAPKALEFEFAEPEFGAPRVGTSLGDTPELMRFFTQGDK